MVGYPFRAILPLGEVINTFGLIPRPRSVPGCEVSGWSQLKHMCLKLDEIPSGDKINGCVPWQKG